MLRQNFHIAVWPKARRAGRKTGEITFGTIMAVVEWRWPNRCSPKYRKCRTATRSLVQIQSCLAKGGSNCLIAVKIVLESWLKTDRPHATSVPTRFNFNKCLCGATNRNIFEHNFPQNLKSVFPRSFADEWILIFCINSTTVFRCGLLSLQKRNKIAFNNRKLCRYLLMMAEH